jgi:hypothetical protein
MGFVPWSMAVLSWLAGSGVSLGFDDGFWYVSCQIGDLIYLPSVQLYKSYSECGIFQLIKQESQQTSALQVFTAGLPAVLAFHLVDWIHFFGENVIETIWDEEDANGNLVRLPAAQLRWKHASQHM